MAGLVEAGYVTRTRSAGTFVAEELPNEALQHAASPAPHRRLIAMMLTQESYSSMSMTSILGGIQRTLTASGCDMLIDWNSTNPRISKENIVRMLEQHVDGFLIYPYAPTRNREEFQLISDAHLPYVLLNRYDPGRSSLYVGSNNFKGGHAGGRAADRHGAQKDLLLRQFVLPQL